MSIAVQTFENNNTDTNQSFKVRNPKDIICPRCKGNIFIDIKDYKINFHDCKAGHKIDGIPLNKYFETQTMDISDIKCKICNNISNEFFLCNTCNNIFCPLCKLYHEQNEKNHIIINYEDRNYICKKHNNYHIKYCSICKKDICFNCQNEHIGH